MRISSVIVNICRQLNEKKYQEKKVSFGNENPEKIFYVIRWIDGGGLFSYVINALGHIKYAIQNNYIPVIDMMNYSNPYLNKKDIGKINSWEYYFEQPFGYSLKDIKNSKNIIISNGLIISDRPRGTQESYEDVNGILSDWRELAHKYIRIKDNIKAIISIERNKIITKEDKVLGIICRGTDYIKQKPKGHWIQPTPEMVIDLSKDVIKNYRCNKIFLATEDKYIYERISSAFGNIVVTNDKAWIEYNGGWINTYNTNRANDEYLKGLEYLTTIAILSSCDCLIGGRVGGTTGALLLGDKFEYTYFFNLGCY